MSSLLIRAGEKRAAHLLARRHVMSSSSTTNNNKDRLGRTLYRQLIRWCKSTNSLIPLSSFVPPVTLQPPHVERESLEKLAAASGDDWQYLHQLLPANSKVEAHQMTVPIANANDAARFFHVVFSLNNNKDTITNQDVVKQRISTAFEALKSLNQLTSELTSIEQQREKHLDRTGVLLHVGQVVQHRTERWRAVITGWQRTDQTTSSVEETLSSLTKKNYGDKDDVLLEETEAAIEKDDIQYSLILDSGDAHLLGGRRNVDSETGDMVAMQSDLDAVQDDSLVRIRSNWTQQKFDRFDSTRQTFVPHAMVQFQYPHDNSDGEDVTDTTDSSPESLRRNELGGEIVSGVQDLSSKLERRILDVTSCSEARGMGLLTSFRQRLSALAQGDVVPDSAFLSPKDVSQSDLAIYHLRQLLNLTLEMSELLWIRELSKENQERLQFSLGQVVKHKKYGFRGVIVAFDPKAAVDVSHWDGLTEIENAGELPFYHIVPDQNDCIEAFGAERPFRYVCEANLEACQLEQSFIDVDMEPEWTRRSDEARYDAPDDARFKYAVDSEEDELTAECLTSIMDDISRLQVAIRESSDDVDSDLSDIVSQLSLANLFDMLQLSETMDGAIVLEETIKEIWKAHSDPRLRSRLDNGISDLVRGNKERALTVFLSLVDEDPDYGEAWNKASTCYYMLGDMQLSLEAAEKTLKLLPKHFQAMNGLGLVHYETRRYKLAAQTFRQSLVLDPWSPVSSRLSACLDMLHGMDLEEEQPSGSR